MCCKTKGREPNCCSETSLNISCLRDCAGPCGWGTGASLLNATCAEDAGETCTCDADRHNMPSGLRSPITTDHMSLADCPRRSLLGHLPFWQFMLYMVALEAAILLFCLVCAQASIDPPVEIESEFIRHPPVEVRLYGGLSNTQRLSRRPGEPVPPQLNSRIDMASWTAFLTDVDTKVPRENVCVAPLVFSVALTALIGTFTHLGVALTYLLIMAAILVLIIAAAAVYCCGGAQISSYMCAGCTCTCTGCTCISTALAMQRLVADHSTAMHARGIRLLCHKEEVVTHHAAPPPGGPFGRG